MRIPNRPSRGRPPLPGPGAGNTARAQARNRRRGQDAQGSRSELEGAEAGTFNMRQLPSWRIGRGDSGPTASPLLRSIRAREGAANDSQSGFRAPSRRRLRRRTPAEPARVVDRGATGSPECAAGRCGPWWVRCLYVCRGMTRRRGQIDAAMGRADSEAQQGAGSPLTGRVHDSECLEHILEFRANRCDELERRFKSLAGRPRCPALPFQLVGQQAAARRRRAGPWRGYAALWRGGCWARPIAYLLRWGWRRQMDPRLSEDPV